MNFFSTWLFFALLSALFAALTNIFMKLGVENINSNMATWIRVVVLVVVLTPLLPLFKQWVPPGTIAGKTWLFLVLSGLASGASWMAMHHALKLGNASQVGPVDKLSVVLVILVGVIFLGEAFSFRQWCGATALATGVLLIAWPTDADRAKAAAAQAAQQSALTAPAGALLPPAPPAPPTPTAPTATEAP